MTKIDKHYRINKEIIDKINSQNDDRFKNEIDAVEFFISKGLEFDGYNNRLESIEKKIDSFIINNNYIKKLLIQMFVNKKFAINREVTEDEAFKLFNEAYNESKIID